MAASFFVLYDGSVAIHDESGGLLDTITISGYLSGSGPLNIGSKLAVNGETVVVANLNTIITAKLGVTTTYNITGCPVFDAAAPVSLSYYGGKFRLLATNDNRYPCSGSWGYSNYIYLESVDGITWTELFDFNTAVLGKQLGYPEISYSSTDGYYYIVDTGFWGGDIYKTSDFSSFSLFAAKPASRRVAFAPVYYDNFVWYTQQYASNSLYLREIIKRNNSGVTTYGVSNVPGTVNSDELSDVYGVLLDADGTPYIYVNESDSISGAQCTAYFFNGSSFVRDPATTTSGTSVSFGPLKPLEYAVSGANNVVLSPVGTYTEYTDPYSIAIRKTNAAPVIATILGYPIDVALNANFVSSNEFWTEEDQCVESVYDYGT
jgi:hypothetical protein